MIDPQRPVEPWATYLGDFLSCAVPVFAWCLVAVPLVETDRRALLPLLVTVVAIVRYLWKTYRAGFWPHGRAWFALVGWTLVGTAMGMGALAGDDHLEPRQFAHLQPLLALFWLVVYVAMVLVVVEIGAFVGWMRMFHHEETRLIRDPASSK